VVVPAKVGAFPRAAIAATWPLGVAWTSFAYIWRTTPLHRRQLDGSLPEDLPPPLPDGINLDEVQRPSDGDGPLFHRTYTGVMRDARMSAEALIARVSADPDQVAPRALAKFRKTTGTEGKMQVGDEFLVHMPGPWDGPVLTIEVTPRSFRFATLAGHLEAGQIEWRASDRDGRLVFQIESWARAGDRLSAVMHDRLLMAKEVQLHMWSSVIERVALFTGGTLEAGIDIDTHRVDGEKFVGSPS
jgi:hypothetical protein